MKRGILLIPDRVASIVKVNLTVEAMQAQHETFLWT